MSKFLLREFLTIIIIVFGLIGIGKSSLGNSEELHHIVNLKGNVKIKIAESRNFQAASFGDGLTNKDELEVSPNSSITINCSDTETRIWKKEGRHKVSAICPSGIPVIIVPNSNNDTLQDPNITEQVLKEIPYIISPRSEYLLSNRLTLRWNKISGATLYKVQIDDVNWETETSDTEVQYSGQILFEEGRSYRVEVSAKGKSSTEEGLVGFKILEQEKAEPILVAVEKIKKRGLTPEAEGLVLAHLYRGYELQTEAVERLEELIKQGSQEPAIYLLSGDIYRDVGLNILARERYSKALELLAKNKNSWRTADVQIAFFC